MLWNRSGQLWPTRGSWERQLPKQGNWGRWAARSSFHQHCTTFADFHCKHAKSRTLRLRDSHLLFNPVAAQIACTANTYFALFLLSENRYKAVLWATFNATKSWTRNRDVWSKQLQTELLEKFQMYFYVNEYTSCNTEYIHSKLRAFLFCFFCFLLLFTSSCPQMEKLRKEWQK